MEVVDLRNEATNIAQAVSIGILETCRVYLVHSSFFPPLAGWHLHCEKVRLNVFRLLEVETKKIKEEERVRFGEFSRTQALTDAQSIG